MWLGLLSRIWPYLAGIVALIGLALYINHAGYKSGYAASEAHWQPLFQAAAIARDEANARAASQEARSTALSIESERRIDETQKTLHDRSADYDNRLRSLSMRLAAASGRCSQMPEATGAPAIPDATAESVRRASEAGGRIAGTGADCEADAATVAEWQRFYMGLRTIINADPTAAPNVSPQ